MSDATTERARIIEILTVRARALHAKAEREQARVDALRTVRDEILDDVALAPNPPIGGHFTGRCERCGSADLWDDNLAYGCNVCGAFLAGNR